MTCNCRCESVDLSTVRIRDLRWVSGLDDEGCLSYQPISRFISALSVQDTQTLDLTLQGNVLSGVVRVSGDAGNALQVRPDGLFVPSSAAPFVTAIQDTSTLDLTVTSGTLSGDVRVSSDAGNALQVRPNGLYVPTPPPAFITAIQDTSTLDLTVTSGTLSGDVRVSAQAGNALQVRPDGLFVPSSAAPFITAIQDTPTLDLTVTGGTLSGDVRVSSDAGNALQVRPDGLFVPSSAAPFITAIQDTSTIDLTVTGGTLSGDVRVSAQAGNTLQVRPDGLFVPPASFTLNVSDTPTVTHTLVGNTLSSNVRVSAQAGNQIQTLADGLFVPPPPQDFIRAVQNTTTITHSVVAGTLSSNVRVSAQAGNALQVLADGLFVSATSYSLRSCSGAVLPNNAQVVACPSNAVTWTQGTHTPVALDPSGNAVRLDFDSRFCVPSPGAEGTRIIVFDTNNQAILVNFKRAVGTYFLTRVVLPNVTNVSPGIGNGTVDDVLIDNFQIGVSPDCPFRQILAQCRFNIGCTHSSTVPGGLSEGQVYIYRIATNEWIARAEAFVYNSQDTPNLSGANINGFGHRWRTEVDSAIYEVNLLTGGGETIQRRIRHGVATGGTLAQRHTTTGINIATIELWHL